MIELSFLLMDIKGKTPSPFEFCFYSIALPSRMCFERFQAAVTQTITPEERGASDAAATGGLLNLAMQAL